MEIKIIPIFFSFNDDYIEPAAVAIYSLLNKTPRHIFYKMHVLCSNIPDSRQQILQNIIKRFDNAELSFINNNGEFEKIFQREDFSKGSDKSVFTADILSKCFAAKFFPQYDKIIYSDVDIVVSDDISELYNINLEDKYLAGVKTPFSQYHENELSHLNAKHYEILHDKYLAGGIWVMNLKKIREDKIEEKMLDIMNNSAIEKRWPEQDIINIACGNKIAFLPLNYIAYPHLPEYLTRPDFVSDYSRDELYDSIINPKIIHYAYLKPWNSSPEFSAHWWSIFNYLNLQKTKIFTPPPKPDEINPEITRLKKKVKKYKTLFTVTLIIAAILLIIESVWLITTNL